MHKLFTPLKILGALAWLVSMGVSVYAVHQSNESARIAQKALDVSQRPYVSLEPVRFDDGNFISLKYINGELKEKMRFKVTNKGASPAQNIRVTPIIFSVARHPINAQVGPINNTQCSTGPGGATALNPGDSTHIEISAAIPLEKREVSSLLEQFDNKTLSVPFNIEVTYDSAALSMIGKVGMSLVFWPEKVDINYSVSE